VRQAQSVLEQARRSRRSPSAARTFVRPLRLGIIYTIGPYLLPELVRHVIEMTPQMPLMLQENFTVKLLDMLRTGELDCAIMAEPFPTPGWRSRRCTTSPSSSRCPAATRWRSARPSARKS